MLELKRVLPQDYWDKVAHLFANEIVLNNWTTVSRIKERLFNDKADLWVSPTLKTVVVGANYKRIDGTKTYVVELMVSEEDTEEDWTKVIEPIETQAKLNGCVSIQIRGRKGWRRLFKHYKLIQVTLEHKL